MFCRIKLFLETIWKDPVWSKVISAAIIAIPGIVLSHFFLSPSVNTPTAIVDTTPQVTSLPNNQTDKQTLNLTDSNKPNRTVTNPIAISPLPAPQPIQKRDPLLIGIEYKGKIISKNGAGASLMFNAVVSKSHSDYIYEYKIAVFLKNSIESENSWVLQAQRDLVETPQSFLINLNTNGINSPEVAIACVSKDIVLNSDTKYSLAQFRVLSNQKLTTFN